MHYVRAQFKKRHYRPAWVEVIRLAYHKYGLKYLALFLVLSAYSFVGAGVFLFFEKPAELERMSRRQRTFEDLRQMLIRQVLDNLFNDTQKPLIFVDASQIEAISRTFGSGLRAFEDVIAEYNSKHSMEPLLKWDLWTALIYAWTVITTIGYGHLFPLTVGGRISTMLYAIFGIPLMLTVLSNVGKLLTKVLKYPFFLIKRLGRRIFRYCTKMSKEQILEADAKDKSTLEVFDLPIPVAIALVIGWIFICSAITLIWEKDWDYLVAFYFFFISLSTIGFGDVVPSKPYYLLVMFGNTMIGMALLSMLLNLIQGKLEPITVEEEEEDPFGIDRNGIQRALRRASMFTKMPWMAQAEVTQKKAQIMEVQDRPSPNGGDALKTVEATKVTVIVEDNGKAVTKRKKSNAARRKSKTDGMAGGAAVSALSTFLAPLFSTLPESEQSRADSPAKMPSISEIPSDKKELPLSVIESQDQLIIIDEDEHVEYAPAEGRKTEQEEAGMDIKHKPLKKTVSFQANDLVGAIDLCYQFPDQSRKSGDYVEPFPVPDCRPPAVVRAVVVADPGEINAESVRLRRVDPAMSLARPLKKKKKRQLSPRESKLSGEHQRFYSADLYEAGEFAGTHTNGGHKKKHHKSTKHVPLSVSADFENDYPQHHSISPAKRISSSTLLEPISWHGSKHHRRVRRADTTPETRVDHALIFASEQDNHSACSICAYHPLNGDTPTPERIYGGKKKQSTAKNHRPQEQEVQLRRVFTRGNAIDGSPDVLPNDEATLFAYLDKTMLNNDQSIPPTHGRHLSRHRHSISGEVTPNFVMSNTRLAMPHSFDQFYPSEMMVRNNETQTMISFPSQDSDSRISISGERGTARLLPESASFTEVNRLVNLNIDAEILRNELASLTAMGSATGDISAYQRVLSLHELIEQVSHEAALPRGF